MRNYKDKTIETALQPFEDFTGIDDYEIDDLAVTDLFSWATIDEAYPLQYFMYDHLDKPMWLIGKLFFDIAEYIVTSAPTSIRRTLALERLKDLRDAAIKQDSVTSLSEYHDCCEEL